MPANPIQPRKTIQRHFRKNSPQRDPRQNRKSLLQRKRDVEANTEGKRELTIGVCFWAFWNRQVMDCEEPIAFHEGEEVLLWWTHLFEFERHKDG